MSSAEVNAMPPSESKAQRKKKDKPTSVNGSTPVTLPQEPPKADSERTNGEPGAFESPYIRELQKIIRNVSKKLNGMQKTDAVIAENPGLTLDDLVKQKKINQDQKTQALKKPQLQTQLAQLEEQISQYKKVDSEYQAQIKKLKEDLEASHRSEVEKLKAEIKQQGLDDSAADLRKKLLIFSQFLRAAAAKRNQEEEADTDESRAFEGALLLVYGGDSKAIDTAVALIEGSEEQVLSIEGAPLPITYSKIRQASIDHAPFQAEEQWVNSVADANAAAELPGGLTGSDPTVATAGLTELDTAVAQVNGAVPEGPDLAVPAQVSSGDQAGNQAGEKWDTAIAGAEKSMEDSFEMIPRPSEEVDDPVRSSVSAGQTSWADDAAAEASGNQAGENWDVKAPGESVADNNDTVVIPITAEGTAAAAVENDGFSEVPGRHRGGRGGRARGEGRGRGRGGFRGDGEFRGRGRGGFRGGRGDGGEFRGRGGGGRGRGPRGGTAGTNPPPS